MPRDGSTDGGAGHLRKADVRHPIRAASLLYTAPPFIMRGPIYLIFLLMISAIVYMVFARKAVVVVTPLVLQRESVTVEALGGGVIERIFAAENQEVQQGRPLVSIRETLRETQSPEEQKLSESLDDAQEALAKAEEESAFTIAQLERQLQDSISNKDVQEKGLRSQIASLQQQEQIAQQQVADARRRAQQAQVNLARAQQQMERRDITRPQFEAAQAVFADAQSAVTQASASREAIAQQRLPLQTQLEALISGNAITSLQAQIEQERTRGAQQVARIEKQIGEINEKLTELRSGTVIRSTAKILRDKDLASYSSGLDGIVTSIPVRQGQIVSVGTPLAVIIKKDAPLQARLLVQNHDIGKIKHNQPVNLKYFAYPYQEWGTQRGEVVEIASVPGTVPGFEKLYEVRVALKPPPCPLANGGDAPLGTIGGCPNGPRRRNLEIGLEGFAEIYTGEKRWIELIFTPLSKVFQNDEYGDDESEAAPAAAAPEGG